MSNQLGSIASLSALKKLLSTIAVIATSIVALSSEAHATFITTNAVFFTAPADGTLIFTFEGKSAADTDTLYFNSDPLFTNNSTPVGTVETQSVTAGQTYQLTLEDLSFGPNTWSSDPTANSDSFPHLVYTDTFSDFNLGATAPFPVSTDCAAGGLNCYFGWEDRPFPGADADYNDLVFALQFTDPPLPEPAPMTIMGSGLIALGLLMRRRRRKAA